MDKFDRYSKHALAQLLKILQGLEAEEAVGDARRALPPQSNATQQPNVAEGSQAPAAEAKLWRRLLEGFPTWTQWPPQLAAANAGDHLLRTVPTLKQWPAEFVAELTEVVQSAFRADSFSYAAKDTDTQLLAEKLVHLLPSMLWPSVPKDKKNKDDPLAKERPR